MSDETRIEWAHDTLNPWQGCAKVSPGCKHCYADELDKRHLRARDRHWGPRAPRLFASDVHMARPLAWNRKAERAGERRRVFCMSMGDFFELHTDPRIAARQGLYRDRVFEMVARTPWLDWLMLTKRPENVQGMVPDAWWRERFPSNVWLGVSIENQDAAEARLPILLDLDEQFRGVRPFLSCEPLLGPLDLAAAAPGYMLPMILHWVIGGSESGSRARPAELDWFRSLRDQCTSLGVPFLFKQWREPGKGKRKVSLPMLDGRAWVEIPLCKRDKRDAP